MRRLLCRRSKMSLPALPVLYRHMTRFVPPGRTDSGDFNGRDDMAAKSKTGSKMPSHEAFVVTGEGDASFWTKIGAAWPHDDGKGFNVDLIAIPVSGRLVIRVRKESKSP